MAEAFDSGMNTPFSHVRIESKKLAEGQCYLRKEVCHESFECKKRGELSQRMSSAHILSPFDLLANCRICYRMILEF